MLTSRHAHIRIYFIRFSYSEFDSGRNVIDTCRRIANESLGQSVGCVQDVTGGWCAIPKCSNCCISAFFENALVSCASQQLTSCIRLASSHPSFSFQYSTTFSERTACLTQWLRTEFDHIPSFIDWPTEFDVADPSNTFTSSIVTCKGQKPTPSFEHVGPYTFACFARESPGCIVRWNWPIFP